MLIKTWIYIEQTYNELWCRVKDLIGKDFEVRALHDNEYITTKTKSYKDEIKSDFHDEALSSDKRFKDLNDCDCDSTSGSYSDSQDKPNYDSN